MSFLETLVILLVAMIVLGPNRLPSAARKIGKVMGAIRRAGDEFRRQLMTMDQSVEKKIQESTADLDALVPTDEELSVMDGSAEVAAHQQSSASTVLLGTPPTSSPDDLWDTPPVPGGLPSKSSLKPTIEASPTVEKGEVKDGE